MGRVELLYVGVNAESLQKKQKYLQQQCGMHLKKLKPFNFSFSRENINNRVILQLLIVPGAQNQNDILR